MTVVMGLPSKGGDVMPRRRGSRQLAAVLVGIWGMIAPMAVSAGSLPSPSEKTILTISGKIDATNKDDTAQFDRAMLEALGTVSMETTTPWHQGRQRFEGVSLAKLMNYVGAKGEYVVAIALNDYVTEIPLRDFVEHGPILAMKRNGEYMPVRDKGPLFIMYPLDSKPELQRQLYYGRCAWQVAKLVVK
jgi:hypothetical protein